MGLHGTGCPAAEAGTKVAAVAPEVDAVRQPSEEAEVDHQLALGSGWPDRPAAEVAAERTLGTTLAALSLLTIAAGAEVGSLSVLAAAAGLAQEYDCCLD